jgi:PleD family two-component response regulator
LARDWFAAPSLVEPVSAELLAADDFVVPVEIAVAPLTYEGQTWAVATVRQTTERRRLDARQVFLAVHDALTGVANRAAFEDAVAQLAPGQFQW